jgi:hypothetical protein
MDTIRENRRVILIGLVLLVLICLVGVLIFRIFTADGNEVTGGIPTPTLSPIEATPAIPGNGTEEPTVTPTRVIQEKPTTAALPTATAAPPATPTSVVKVTATRAATVVAGAPVAQASRPGPIENLLKNSDFEQGFDERGVALAWQPFKNDGVQALYGRETFPYVASGSNAQRITMVGATTYNRYGGISQQVEVAPNQVYTLTLHGQIRTGFGDVSKSSYGYRMQYAVANLQNWQNVAEADWIELPWDEQLLNASVTQFYSYTATLQPTSDKLTLFVRAWNKWPDPGEAQYTFDSFSLVGPGLISETIIAGAGPAPTAAISITTSTTTPSGEQMINKPLPVTGADDGSILMRDGRFWIGMIILLFLAVGAIYRARWGYR